MKITFISDTHGYHNEISLLEGDILIHSGDITDIGKKSEVDSFLKWFNIQPFQHKIFIAGNHDFFLDYDYQCYTEFGRTRHNKREFGSLEEIQELISKYPNVTYLNDSGCIIDGINIWGSPIQPWYHDWAYNRGQNDITKHWDLIPNNTDILITHGPPFGKLDVVERGLQRVGCPQLMSKIEQIKPKIHCLGHIHESYGMTYNEDTTFINASICNLNYNPINKPITLEI